MAKKLFPSKKTPRRGPVDTGVFQQVEGITGQIFPRDQQTPAMQAILTALFDKAIDTDGLTGLANRRAFTLQLDKQLERMARYNKGKALGASGNCPQITLVAVDLDGFKSINDTHGHAAGDAALKHFADFLQTNLRPGDVAARTGGDEFLLLIEAPQEATQKMLGRLRDKLVKSGFSYEGASPYLSFSYGTRQLRMDDKDPDAVIEEADAALYKDKKNKHSRMPDAQGDGQSATRHARRPDSSTRSR